MTAKKEKNIDALGGDLSNMLEPSTDNKSEAVSDGKPLILDINLIDDNPLNRTDVSEDFKVELTADIKAVGVKEPISVRNHPEVEGRYMINSGHTRKECSLRAKKTTIPAYIDNDFSDYDIVRVNIKREKQSPKSIAEFIERRLKAGDKKGDIAKGLGKSAAFVSQHVALLNLQPTIHEVFESGRCNDVTLVNDLVRLHKKNPECVDSWLEDEEQDITRNSYKQLCDFIEHKNKSDDSDSVNQNESGEGSEGTEGEEEPAKPQKPKDPTVMSKFVIRIEYQGREGMLLPKIRPTEKGFAYIKFDDDGDEIEADVKDIIMTSIIEA